MKHIKAFDEFISESYYSYLGGSTPYDDKDMRKTVVEPNLGKRYDSYIMFKDDDYNKMKSKFAPNTDGWKKLYRSRSSQGQAFISPDGKVIKAAILDGGGIVGAIYIKK
jgi:hypothetical protein